MNEKEFSQLIDKDKYQVFLFSSPLPIPLNFAIHTWFVIHLKGKIHRWEFGRFRGSPYKNGIGVLKDYLKPTDGMNLIFWRSSPKFSSKLINFIEGDDHSMANKLALHIETKSNAYPFKNIYSLTGPNSNSYIQWILNEFPNSSLKLPLNAFGKGFKFNRKHILKNPQLVLVCNEDGSRAAFLMHLSNLNKLFHFCITLLR